jgi:hypothetical protein
MSLAEAVEDSWYQPAIRCARRHTYLARILPLAEQHFHLNTNVPSDKYEIDWSPHLRRQAIDALHTFDLSMLYRKVAGTHIHQVNC